METTINLIIFTILIVLTAFFVATEFAIVKVRHSRLSQLVTEGKPGSQAAQKVVSQLDEYLSACQLGITITALGIGMVGEKTFEFILHPFFTALGIPHGWIHGFTIAGAFVIATFLHVVVGELAPKTIAIQKAEAVTLLFSKPIMFFYKILYPFIWILNGSARLLIRLLGIKPVSEHEMTHSEEELRLLLSDSYQSGEIDIEELNVINNVFEFDDKVAREIMTPRNEIIGFDVTTSMAEVLKCMTEERYTRYPVYEGDKDQIIGFIHMKDFIKFTMMDKESVMNMKMTDYINPVIRDIESVSLNSLLQKMRQKRIHLAILMDEYGGTSGLVTIEDIIEELVGEIRDEHDEEEPERIVKIADHHYKVHSSAAINDIEKLLDITIERNSIDTMGGWMALLTEESDEVFYEGYIFHVLERDEHQINWIEIYESPSVVTE
ncbi:hemolysin family protein [Macrococcus carouselicus]|uniref:HlyC/CorC family transporter n=1 Tax=Macrococcus carouselicus TaxID=69969 RepID=A0A9Q8CM52_9STAP|nr:hemolysin family protein [Macrococcus carouselicus]TDM02453.1 HlyC/CorC family transporter [Macrococcus carouselicus]